MFSTTFTFVYSLNHLHACYSSYQCCCHQSYNFLIIIQFQKIPNSYCHVLFLQESDQIKIEYCCQFCSVLSVQPRQFKTAYANLWMKYYSPSCGHYPRDETFSIISLLVQEISKFIFSSSDLYSRHTPCHVADSFFHITVTLGGILPRK